MAALVVALVPAIWLASPASAAPASLQVTPASVAAGGSVQVTGTCEANTTGFAISNAFLHDATHEFAGVGAAPFTTDASGTISVTAQIPAGISPGTYDVTGRCGGGNLGITAKLTVTAAPPTAVPAGTGGQAAPASSRTPWILGGIGTMLLLVGGAGVVRRRATR